MTPPASTPLLETSRLLLRPLRWDDAPAIQHLFGCWDVVRLLSSSVPWPYPSDAAANFLHNIALPAIRAGTAWHWSIRLKTQPDTLIGMISLTLTPDDHRGFWLAPEWQRQGLMTEACNVVTDFWFGPLAQPVLRVPKALENIASRRISERSGMRVVWTGERDYVGGRLPAALWEITRDDWLAYRKKISGFFF